MVTIGNWAPSIAVLVTTVTALIAAVIDFRRLRVPNVLTFPLFISGLLFHTAISGLEGFQHSILGFGVGMVVLMGFYVMGVMGAGDVKLLAAVGAWLGGNATFYVFCVAGIATGIYSLAALASQRRLHDIPLILQVGLLRLMVMGRYVAGSDPASLDVLVRRTDRHKYVMPFAMMIAIGVVIVAVKGWA